MPSDAPTPRSAPPVGRRVRLVGPVILGLLLALPVLLRPRPAEADRAEFRSATVAQVGDEVITRGDVERYAILLSEGRYRELRVSGTETARARMREQEHRALEKLVERRIYLAEVERRSLRLSPGEEREIERIIEERGGRTRLRDQLDRHGLSMPTYEKWLRDTFRIQRLLRQVVGRDVYVQPDAVRTYHARNVDEFRVPGVREVTGFAFPLPSGVPLAEREAAIEDLRASIREAIDRAREGAGLVEAAEELDLQCVRIPVPPDISIADALPAACAEPARDLEQGEYSPIVETERGFYVVRADRVVHERVRPFVEVADSIRARLRQMRFSAEVQRFTAELRERTYVRRWPGRLE